MSRRQFIAALPLAMLAARWGPAPRRRRRPHPHPDPRPGITGENVLPAHRVTKPAARPAYAMAREIPEVFDGLHCYCECDGGAMQHRSLLACFETTQAAGCYACREQAELAYARHKKGATLDQIRTACDREFAD
ncbi:MAG TPA: hypothetical protein VNA89_04720 [Gemmatimonadaceae bacterium]|nr:hypothetical protein [Gemmatimonadaceae bacterium]